MSKKMKKISALLLAVVMILSMSVMASAANLRVYLRTYGSASNPTEMVQKGSFIITNVDSTDSVYEALWKASSNNSSKSLNLSAGTLTTNWSNYSTTYYLENLNYVLNGVTVVNGASSGSYSDLVPDGNGGYAHGKWSGYSWMWRPYDNDSTSLIYPNTAMSAMTCDEAEYAILLSYDYSSFTW